MTVYRIFDIAIACDFPVPGLIELQQQDYDWRIELAGKAFRENRTDWFHSWKGPGGNEIMACARLGEAYILKINGMACFSIDYDLQQILIFAEDDCPENTLSHLLIDQVIPRVLCHRGRMVLHASAVELSGGRAVAFTGLSGQGKSTLATAFFSAGHRLVTDDCLLLENRGGAVYVKPSYPSLRLWPDTARAVAGESAANRTDFSEVAHYSNKKQILFEADEAVASSGWVKLERLYLLEGDATKTDASAIRISPLGGMASIMTLIESMFTLDTSSDKSIRKSFETVQQVAGGVSVKRLSYPRRYELLPQVLAAVNGDQP
jgi:hypothetical protein